jgi:peptidoglycan DL-endopeptidase CwlO
MYGRGAGVLDVASGMDAINASAVKEGYSAALFGSAGDTVDVIRAARQDIDHIVKDLAVKQQRQMQLKERINTNQAKVVETQTQLDDIAKRLDAELTVLVADEAAKQEQERMLRERQATERVAAKAAQAKAVPNVTTASPRPAAAPTILGAVSTTPRPTAKPATSSRPTSPATSKPVTAKTSTPPVVVPNFPAPSGGAATAIAEAKRQLGKPYVFGSNGPNTFDCSGLTQWAWAKAGVSMSHYTVSQYNEFPHVPLNALQPGDLVFFKIDLGHMGMYLGGGLVIHAPQTGDVVKMSPLSNFNVVGAARPG